MNNTTEKIDQWKPLVFNIRDKNQIEQKILEIAVVIKENYKLFGRVGFLKGNAGVLAFMYYTNSYFNKNIFNHEIDECFQEIIQEVTLKNNASNSFCEGLAGFIWAMNLFNTIGFIDSSSDGSLDEVLAELQKDVQLHIEKGGNFDYLYGSSIFLAEELIPFDNSLLIDSLMRKIVETDSGSIKVPFVENSHERQGLVYDYGIAHGTTGVIGCLSANYERTQNNNIKNLIERLIAFYFESILFFYRYL